MANYTQSYVSIVYLRKQIRIHVSISVSNILLIILRDYKN
nr:hypothetical protein CoNPh38_CDS0378 [Staphylococcus phage S-CoN_Ph38]